MKSIKNATFSGCTRLLTVNIPESVECLGENVFSNCTSLVFVNIPPNLTDIGSEAFSGCRSLKKINIPTPVWNIGYHAFEGCDSLVSIELHCRNVKSWFSGINSILSISVGEEVEIIESSAFKECTALTSLSLSSGLTKIGDEAFSNCTALNEVILPDTVEIIGEKAFYCCRNLTTLFLSKNLVSIGESAFLGCSSLTALEIQSNVKAIGTCAFANCKSLISILVNPDNLCFDSRDNCNAIIETATNKLLIGCTGSVIPQSVTAIASVAFFRSQFSSVHIPASVTEIDEYAFVGCECLDSIQVDECNLVYDSRDNCNAVIHTTTDTLVLGCKNTVIPGTVKIIDKGSFFGNTGLVSIDIPEGVKIIKEAFVSCSELKSVTIPKSVTFISSMAFKDCTGLPVENGLIYAGDYLVGVSDKSLSVCSIKEGTRIIGYEAFAECENLQSAVIPDTVCKIGSKAFYNCKSLKAVNIPSLVPCIEQETFFGCSALTDVVIRDGVKCIDDNAFYGCESLQKLTVPESVNEIGYNAFEGCSRLQQINIPVEVTEIRSYTFKGLTSLCSIDIPKGVTCIMKSAFENCSSLSSVIIPEGLTKIGSDAFKGCARLQHVAIPNSITRIGESAFAGCASLLSVTIPENVERFGSRVFSGCSSLEYIHCRIKNPLATKYIAYEYRTTSMDGTRETTETVYRDNIPSDAFDGIKFDQLTLYIPHGTEKSYRDHLAFRHFKNIVTDNPPTSSPIDTFIFEDEGRVLARVEDKFITSAIIAESVTAIAARAFAGCACLKSLTIPTNVKQIGVEAFINCVALREIHICFRHPNRVVINANEFNDVDVGQCVLYVPKYCKQAYHDHPAFRKFIDIREETYLA